MVVAAPALQGDPDTRELEDVDRSRAERIPDRSIGTLDVHRQSIEDPLQACTVHLANRIPVKDITLFTFL